MYTLNQILSLIENEANAHLQVKQFGQGDVWEINPKELDYLVLWAIEEGVVLNERTLTYNIRLLAMDRVLTGEENEQEVMSDTIQVLLDFVAYFRQLHTTDLSIQTSVSFEPFTERFDDKVSGHACVLSITQPYDYNKCQIPQTTNTIPPTVDGITLYDFCNQATLDRLTLVQIACLEAAFGLPCVDATVENSDASYSATVASGSTLVLPNINFTDSDGITTSVPSVQNIVATPIPPCADATVELNGVEMTTIQSGDTENISIRQSSGATEVGSKQGTHWRIDDSAISINGSPVADVKAEDPLDIDVTQGGSPVGSWSGSAWIIPPDAGGDTLTIGVFSDAGHTAAITTADFGDTIYVKLTSTGIPTTYDLWLPTIEGDFVKVSNGTGEFTWVVNAYGSVILKAGADDVAYALPFSLTIGYTVKKVLQLDGTQWGITDGKVYNDVFQGNFYTVSMRFRATSLANLPLLMALESHGSQVVFEVGATKVYAGIGGFRTYTTTVATGVFHELVFVKTGFGNNANVYLNGVLLGSFSGAVGNISPFDQKIFFGRYVSGGLELTGYLGDIRIWNNHAASGAQVLAHYNSGVPVHPIVMGKAPHLWYDMDGDMTDRSGNGFDASTVNSPSFVTPP